MEPRQPPAETYTLDEARQKLARDECAIHGHDYDVVVEQGTNGPASLVCGRCSEAWDVAGDRYRKALEYIVARGYTGAEWVARRALDGEDWEP